MQFIITNTDQGFTRQECEDWVTKRSCLLQAQLITKRTHSNQLDTYFFHLPLLEKRFSIVGDTLYWNKQWIGTISSELNTHTKAEVKCIYFNYIHARSAFEEYLPMPIFHLGSYQPSLKNKKTSKHKLFSNQPKNSLTENTASEGPMDSTPALVGFL
jgi:hypothetical protein